MIKNRIKEIREKHNLSQLELGKIVGCSKNKILRYENCYSDTPTDVLIKIADYFNVSLDYLCDRQFSNNLGYVQEERRDFIRQIVDLSDKNFEKVVAYTTGLCDKN